MTITSEDIKKWNSRFETKIMDRKSHKILSEPWKLAKLMTAFANNIKSKEDFGGRILIGISNKGVIENFKPKESHQGSIMNIARENCIPGIEPEFEDVEMEDGATVYVVTIPKMTTIPFGIKSKHGIHYKIRSGDQVRDPEPHELDGLFEYGRNYGKTDSKLPDIDLGGDSRFTKFVLKHGRNYVTKKYNDIKKSINREILALQIIGGLILIPLFANIFYPMLMGTSSVETVYLGMGLSLLIIPTVFLFAIATIAKNRRCDKCNSNFGIEKIESKLLDEEKLYETSDSVRMREIHKDTFKCAFCNHTDTKTVREEYSTDKR